MKNDAGRTATVRLPVLLAAAALALCGCTQLPPTPEDIQAKRFETLPDKSVIYIVRDIPDSNDVPATIVLDNAASVTTYPGTYYRWEVPPGRHRIAGLAADTGVIELQTAPGRIYYVQQRLAPFQRYAASYLQPVPEQQGRAVVMRGEHVR